MPAAPRSIVHRTSTYALDKVGIGIVHIGLGAFHRAHQAVYIERHLERCGGGDWGICAANIRSNRPLTEQLAVQKYRYHVAEFADREHLTLREIRSIRHAVFAGNDSEALLGQMTSAGTRIVSLTVTEKGYYLNPASGELLLDHPAIAQDLARPFAPRTAPGLLLEALRRRQASGSAPFTVLCCDNMPDNGRRTRAAVIALAARASTGLADWIDREVAFPSTMVDRIVPAPSESSRRDLSALIGRDDRAAVICEAFSQWVIEDRFPLGRPDWEREGVQMVRDVRPYETMKLRLLNGCHSLLAYVGLLRGRRTVAEAIADPVLNRLARDYLAEATASLEDGVDMDLAAYAGSLLERFANDALEHRLSQIAMDGSQKLPQRLLEGVLVNLERDRTIRATALAVAAWMHYVRGIDANDRSYTVDDPLAAQLADCHRRHAAAADLVDALLAMHHVFPEPLAGRPAFRNAVLEAYRRLPRIENEA